MKSYSPDTYRRLLELLLASHYQFADFTITPMAPVGRLVYLRHDIDYSVEWALALAGINANAGVSGTFFFQLRSPNYNLHAHSTIAAIREICALGQRTALHFAIGDNALAGEEPAARILADHAAMRAQVPELAPVFSWHNPSVFPGLLAEVPDIDVPGLVNTYARQFVERVRYYSESNLRYAVEELEAIVLKGEPRLQLLFHPFQWLAGGRNMQEILANTWIQVLREKEQEFLTNHVYRQLFPEGMPQEWLQQLAARITTHRAH
jgi:hypothetical protein